MKNQKEAELIQLLQKKVEYFCVKKLPVHLKFKSGYFKNGYIVKYEDDLFILDEFKDGQLAVFFLELEKISEYKSIGEIK